jgi:hypothetical protein
MEYGDENEPSSANTTSNKGGLSKQGTMGKGANKTGLSQEGKKVAQKNRKFKGISSVGQLKHLLRNYDALVES